MYPSTILLALFRFLLPPALIGTVYLYTFPFLTGCGFPLAKPAESACYFGEAPRPAVKAEHAPFRLLAIGDPQLEGDTSLPDPNAPWFPGIRAFWENDSNENPSDIWTRLEVVSKAVLTQDVPRNFQSLRKRLDLWGNDRYLAHVYYWTRLYTSPTHVVVLGDLLGSQWISDHEFSRRSTRFWKTVFTNGKKVPQEVMDTSGARPGVLGQDKNWKNRIIAVAGNHDVGYAGDVSRERVDRFEKEFGRVNWSVRFRLGESEKNVWGLSLDAYGGLPNIFSPDEPELRLIILNSMNLDGPAHDSDLRRQSHEFLQHELSPSTQSSPKLATILLTHIPLHKEAGVCPDSPLFNHWPTDRGGGIREQNHLSEASSQIILTGLARSQSDSPSIILNGHDHEGCDTYHSMHRNNQHKSHAHSIDLSGLESDSDAQWSAQPYEYARRTNLINNASVTGLHEVTVRSIMGDFDGSVGFLSAWWDEEQDKWRFEYASCAFGVQHIWWAIWVTDIVVFGVFGIGGVLAAVIEVIVEETSERARIDAKVKKA